MASLKPEMETKTEWGADEEFVRWLGKIIEDTIRCCYVHPVTFQLVWKTFPKEFDFEDADGEISEPKEWKSVKLSWDTVIFPHETKCIFGRKHGGDKTFGDQDIEIPASGFEYEISNEKGITIRDITEGVYRLKLSKYEYWKELFCRLKIYHDPFKIVVDFDG